jgi:hypothetical protein
MQHSIKFTLDSLEINSSNEIINATEAVKQITTGSVIVAHLRADRVSKNIPRDQLLSFRNEHRRTFIVGNSFKCPNDLLEATHEMVLNGQGRWVH